MDPKPQPITPAFDLLSPADRFVSSSRLHGRMQRWRLLAGRFWWVIGLILALVLGPVYYYTAQLPPEFKSRARLWLTGRVNVGEGRLYTEELIDYLATQAELLRSPAIQQKALARLRAQYTNGLPAAVYSGSKGGFGPLHKLKALVKNLAGMTSTNAVEDSFPFTVKVDESSKSSTLDLKATGNDRATTRAYLNCLIEEFFAFKKETREKAFNQTLASVSREAGQLKNELKAQQEKVHEFQSSNNVVFLQEQGSSDAGYLAQLNRRIASARTELQLLKRLEPEQWIDVESRRHDSSGGEAAAEASGPNGMAGLAGPQQDMFKARQQAEVLKAKRDELSRFLRPLHPKIAKLNEEIQKQEMIIEVSRKEALRQLENRRQALDLQLKNLETAFDQYDRKAIVSSRKIADYDNLRLDLQRLQTADDRMLGLIQNVDVSRATDQENVGVLQPASAARRVPRMIINMGCALAAVLGLSFTVMYCLGLFDDRFASPLELSGYLSEQVLGQIPAIPINRPKGQLGARFLERQRFEFVESFRNIRSALLFMRNGETRPKTLLITSSLPGEGKSTVALFLAATMAMANSRVLLIDGDMRRSSLHKFFAVQPRPGLADVLGEVVSPADAIVPSDQENLFLLPAGVAETNPGELVLSSGWSRLLAELHPQFDYILIDSPPLLATDDAASLAPHADGVLMIVRGQFTSARLARRGLELLKQRRAHVLGLVFNRCLPSASGYHQYGYYRRQYQWHPESAKQIA